MSARSELTAIAVRHGVPGLLLRAGLDAYRAEVMAEAADLAEDVGAHLHRGYENEQSNGAMKVVEALRRVAQGPGDPDKT